MQVTSFEFLIFFLAVAVVNFLLPKKFRMYWLLASSYYFYIQLAPVYALFLVFSTVVTYAAGILIEKKSDAKNCAAGNRSAAGASCGSHSTPRSRPAALFSFSVLLSISRFSRCASIPYQ